MSVQEPNLDLNKHIQAVHDIGAKSDNDKHDADAETIKKILPMIFDENKIQDQKRPYDLIQMIEINGEINQPFKEDQISQLL